MKTNKYICVLAAAAMMLAGCDSENYAVDNGSDNGNQVPDTSLFSGVISDQLENEPAESCDGEEEPSTRSTISGGDFTSWSESDIVSVSDGVLNYQYHPTEINGTSCKFVVVDGKNQFDKNLTGNENFYVFYPAAAVTSWNGPTINSMVYAQQLYSENIDNGVMGAYMATKGVITGSENVSFDFKHCCSVIEVNLSSLGVTPKSVSLKSNSGVSIAGRIGFDIESGKITVSNNDATDYSYSTQSDVITLSEVASDATIARFYILPVQLKGGVTVTVQDVNGNFYTKKTSADIGTTASDITMENVDGAVVCKPYYKKVNFGAASGATRKNNWMAAVPSNLFFSVLSLPGSHNSATSGVTSFTDQAKTQSLSIPDQLTAGVRGFDFRPYSEGSSTTAENIMLKHGSTLNVSTGVKLVDALNNLTTFLDNNPTEALYLTLHEEDGSSSGSAAYTAWNNAVGTCLSNISNYIVAIPSDGVLKLSECRGKIIVISRDPFTTNANNQKCGKIGSYDNSIETKDVKTGANHGTSTSMKLRAQDYYDYDNYGNKKSYIEQLFNEIGKGTKNMLYMNSLNVAYKALNTGSHISTTATAINKYVSTESTTLLSATTPFGMMFGDFIGDSSKNGKAVLDMIIAQNFKYCYSNRTRVKTTPSGTTPTGSSVSADEYADDTQVYSKRRK